MVFIIDKRIAAQTHQNGREWAAKLKGYRCIGKINRMSVWRVLVGVAYTTAFVYAIVKIILG
jgi:hypothetical protein